MRGVGMSETTHEGIGHHAFCQYCGGKVQLGFYFTCHVCGDVYCYIHMSRHSKAHAPQAERQPTHVYAS